MIYWDAQPRRTITTILARFNDQPVNERYAQMVFHEADTIWSEILARGDTMPHGNDLQCLILLNRFANKVREYGVTIPDFLYLSVTEYLEARNRTSEPPLREI
jgi:hypothetical protein